MADGFHALGEAVSLGCVRLLVVDARWIYENIDVGTVVNLVEKPLDTYLTKWLDPICISANAEDAVFPFPESLKIEGLSTGQFTVGDEITIAAIVRFDNGNVLDKTDVVDWDIKSENESSLSGNVLRAGNIGTVTLSARYRHLKVYREIIVN